jgi:hypothetical protein
VVISGRKLSEESKKWIARPKIVKQVLHHIREINFDNVLLLLMSLLWITNMAYTFSQKISKELIVFSVRSSPKTTSQKI